MLGIRRRGFQTSRSPATAQLALAGRLPIAVGTNPLPLGDGDNFFIANFSSQSQPGFPANCYNFTTREPNNLGGLPGGESDGNQNWSATHLPTGGYGGGPALRITMFSGRQQYGCFYTTPSNGLIWALGDTIWFRIRFRFSTGFLFTPSWRSKFVMHGSTGVSPNSRVIAYMNTRGSNLGACLGWSGFVEGTPYVGGAFVPWTIPSYFGLTGPNDFSSHGSRFGSIGMHQNISYENSGPALLCQPGDVSPVRPGAAGCGAIPVEGWYHLQIAATSGLRPNSRFRMWANTNDINNPTSDHTLHPTNENGLGVTGWSGATHLGGYVDQNSPQDQSIDISAFEVGRSFRSDWYPG